MPICTYLYICIIHDIIDRMREHTANAISLSSITATVRNKGVACPKCLTPVRDQLPINLTNTLIPIMETKDGSISSSHLEKLVN